jgi:hypothetical protein
LLISGVRAVAAFVSFYRSGGGTHDIFIALFVFLPLATLVSAVSIGSNISLLLRQAVFRRAQLQAPHIAHSLSTKMTMPSSLTIAAGQTSATFLIRTVAVKNTERATIKATSAVGNAQLGVTISAPNIASFTVPATVYEGVAGIATLTMDNAPVGQDAIVTVTTNSNLVQVPEFVVVPKGKKTVTFPVSAVALPEAYWPWVRVNIDESIKLSRFAVSKAIIREIVLPTSTLGGLSVPGVIKLHGKPSENMTVSFATASAALTKPANVTIPSGASEGTFTLATKPVFTSTFATLSATARGASAPRQLTTTRAAAATGTRGGSASPQRGLP